MKRSFFLLVLIVLCFSISAKTLKYPSQFTDSYIQKELSKLKPNKPLKFKCKESSLYPSSILSPKNSPSVSFISSCEVKFPNSTKPYYLYKLGNSYYFYQYNPNQLKDLYFTNLHNAFPGTDINLIKHFSDQSDLLKNFRSIKSNIIDSLDVLTLNKFLTAANMVKCSRSNISEFKTVHVSLKKDNLSSLNSLRFPKSLSLYNSNVPVIYSYKSSDVLSFEDLREQGIIIYSTVEISSNLYCATDETGNYYLSGLSAEDYTDLSYRADVADAEQELNSIAEPFLKCISTFPIEDFYKSLFKKEVEFEVTNKSREWLGSSEMIPMFNTNINNLKNALLTNSYKEYFMNSNFSQDVIDYEHEKHLAILEKQLKTAPSLTTSTIETGLFGQNTHKVVNISSTFDVARYFKSNTDKSYEGYIVNITNHITPLNKIPLEVAMNPYSHIYFKEFSAVKNKSYVKATLVVDKDYNAYIMEFTSENYCKGYDDGLFFYSASLYDCWLRRWQNYILDKANSGSERSTIKNKFDKLNNTVLYEHSPKNPHGWTFPDNSDGEDLLKLLILGGLLGL